MVPEELPWSDVVETMQSEEAKATRENMKAGLREKLIRLHGEENKCIIWRNENTIRLRSIQVAIDNVNRIMQELNNFEPAIGSDSARSQVTGHQGSGRQSMHEHVMDSDATPCIDGFRKGLTWQERQEQVRPSRVAVKGLSSARSVNATSGDEKDWQPVTTPNSRKQMDCRATLQSSRRLRYAPMIISNEPPEAHERLGPVDLFIISCRDGRKRPCTGSLDSGALVNVATEGFAMTVGALLFHNDISLPEIQPFGDCNHRIIPKFRFDVLVEFPGIKLPCWTEFYAVDNKIMKDDECILSVKTCLKTGLVLDGLANHWNVYCQG